MPNAVGEQANGSERVEQRDAEVRDEVSTFRRSFEQAQALTTLGAKPLVVVSASETMTGTAGWGAAQQQLAARWSNSDRRTVTSSHGGVLDDPTAFTASIAAITDVVDAVRSDSSLTMS